MNGRRHLELVLIVVAVAGLLPLGAAYFWGFELFSHFRIQYIALAALGFVIAILLRSRVAALALVLAGGVNAWPLLPYLPRGERPLPPEALAMLNVNVNAGNENHEDIIESLRGADFDFVTLLELTPDLDGALRALAAQYPYTYSIPTQDNFGIGVLSRRPLIEPKPFPTGRTMGIDTIIELPMGRVRFLAVHLVPPMSPGLALERNRQLELLAGYARKIEAPLIVCGDFNLTPYSPYFARFAREAGLTDVRRGLGLDISWPTFMPLAGIPIDHCLTRGPMEVLSVERMATIGSDHYPVRVSLSWQTQE